MKAAAVLAWILLVVAVGCALACGATLLSPGGFGNSQIEMLMVVVFAATERGYRFVLWPLGFAVVAWLLWWRHPRLSAWTVGASVVALVLLLKPVMQAWQFGGTLPAQMTAAFGPAGKDRAAFSFRALFAGSPESAPFTEMTFRGPLKLDFYRAIGRTSPAPCIVSLHGGGWYSGSHRDRRPVDFWLARQGYAVATIDYGLIPFAQWPQQKTDVLDAIAFLRTHAAEFGIDPQRIVLLGHSAGAQIAEATAYSAHDPGIRGVIACYGPADLREGWRNAEGWTARWLGGRTVQETLALYLGGSPEKAGVAYDSASGLMLAGKGCPPTLLIQGGSDPLLPVRQNLQLEAKLAASGVPHALVVVPWASHHFDLVNFSGPGAQVANYAIERFLVAVTR